MYFHSLIFKMFTLFQIFYIQSVNLYLPNRLLVFLALSLSLSLSFSSF